VTALRAASIERRPDHKRAEILDSLVIGPSLDRYEPAEGRLHRCGRPASVRLRLLCSSC